jgi:signal transduction histidine kinase
VVDSILDYVRIEDGSLGLSPDRLDLADVVRREAEPLAELAAQAGQTLELRLPAVPALVEGDASRLGQVLFHLVSNAVRFTPAGGTIAVELDEVAEGWRLSVQDTGIGIGARDLPRVFDKFFQVDAGNTRAPGGMGLGLTIARALVEAHDGRIGAVSVPGRGSSFWVELPPAATAAGCVPFRRRMNRTHSPVIVNS